MRRAMAASASVGTAAPTARFVWVAAAALVVLGGVAARLRELGAWGFSNDEAWVALSSRVVGLEQSPPTR
jgi:hypothetical protein